MILAVGALLGPPRGLGAVLFSDVVVVGLLLGSALATAARARRDRDARRTWLLATFGLVLWAAAEFVYRTTEGDPSAFYPPPAQLLLACAFAAAYLTLGLLARRRVTSVDPVLALDGAIAGLTAAAAVAVWLLPPGSAPSDPSQPGDALFIAALGGLCFVICVMGLTGWRPGRLWGLITIGIVCNVAGHVTLVQLLDGGTWQRGTIADPLLISGAVFLALAARTPVGADERVARAPRRLPVPLGAGMAALMILTVAALGTISVAATVLAATALVVALVRMTVALELVDRTNVEARTDALTSLGNRRALIDELHRRIEDAEQIEPFTLALFDLDGFKAYNDRFGHLGGDALLRRLAYRLSSSVQPGMAFRMGGDEFCAVFDGDDDAVATALQHAGAALTERGDGFSIRGSCGTVCVPQEASTVTEALQRADTRMYADKRAGDRTQGGEPHVRLRRGLTIDDPLFGTGPVTLEVNRELDAMANEPTVIARAVGEGDAHAVD